MPVLYTCKFCDYTCGRKYNLERHLCTKHLDTYTDTQEETYTETNTNTCSKCSKEFMTVRWFKHHEQKCQGLNSHVCEFCKLQLSTICNKYRHYKTCKEKKAIESTPPTVTTVTHQTNIQTQNNIGTQNNNVNIIVFNPEDMKFLTDHIDMKKITKMMAQDTRRPEDRQEPRNIVSMYGRDLLERPENKCIQKKNLRANYAKVHLGKNKWKSMLDQDVYPKLACDIANTFQKFLYNCTDDVKTNIRLYVRERMIPYLDYMAEQGYCNDEERAKEIMEQFNSLVQELRLVTFDLTERES